jgi:hypothetical protein
MIASHAMHSKYVFSTHHNYDTGVSRYNYMMHHVYSDDGKCPCMQVNAYLSCPRPCGLSSALCSPALTLLWSRASLYPNVLKSIADSQACLLIPRQYSATRLPRCCPWRLWNRCQRCRSPSRRWHLPYHDLHAKYMRHPCDLSSAIKAPPSHHCFLRCQPLALFPYLCYLW